MLDKDNIRALKRSGVTVFLDRALENLTASDDRPLASKRSALERLYSQRYELYKAAAEITIDANKTLVEEAREVLKEAEK